MGTFALTDRVYKSTGEIEGGVSNDKNDIGNYIGRKTDGTFVATRYGVTFDFWYNNVKGKKGSPSKEEQAALIKEFNSSIPDEKSAKKTFEQVYFTKPVKGNLSLGNITDEATQSFVLDAMVNQSFTFNNTSSRNIYEAITAAGGSNTGDIVKDLNSVDQEQFRNQFLKVRANRYAKSQTFGDHGKGWMKRLDENSSYWEGEGFSSGVNEDFSFQDLVSDQTKGNYSLDLTTPEKTNEVFASFDAPDLDTEDVSANAANLAQEALDDAKDNNTNAATLAANAVDDANKNITNASNLAANNAQASANSITTEPEDVDDSNVMQAGIFPTGPGGRGIDKILEMNQSLSGKNIIQNIINKEKEGDDDEPEDVNPKSSTGKSFDDVISTGSVDELEDYAGQLANEYGNATDDRKAEIDQMLSQLEKTQDFIQTGDKSKVGFVRGDDGTMTYTNDRGQVKTFDNLADYQNFKAKIDQQEKESTTPVALNTDDLSDFALDKIKGEYDKENDIPFGDFIKTSLKVQVGGAAGIPSALKDVYGYWQKGKNTPDWDDLSQKAKEDFMLKLAEDNNNRGYFDAATADQIKTSITNARQLQKEEDFKKGIIRNDDGEIIDTMADVVNRDLTTVRDNTNVDLGEVNNVFDQANTQPIEEISDEPLLKGYAGDRGIEDTNPFATGEVDTDEIVIGPDPLENEEFFEEDVDDIGDILTPEKKEKKSFKDSAVGTFLKDNAGVLAASAAGLLAAAGGRKHIKEAMKDIPIKESHQLDGAWKGYMSKMREMASSGLTAQEKIAAQSELSTAYNLGVKNVMRAAGGSRASFLANTGVLNANRVKGLLKLTAMDAAMQRQNLQSYGKAVQYQQQHGQTKGKIDQQMAYNEAKRKSDLHGTIGNALIETALGEVSYAARKAQDSGYMDAFANSLDTNKHLTNLTQQNAQLQADMKKLQEQSTEVPTTTEIV